MTLRFVKTSILTSTDGIEFGNEISVDSEEVIKARVAAEAAKNKPLYQQLADIKEKKQEEYNENTKKIFAPPKALDEDEVEFFNELEEAKQKAALANRKHDDSELEAFRQARKIDMLNNNANSMVPLINFAPIPSNKVESVTNNAVQFTVKRKLSTMKDNKSDGIIQNNKKPNQISNEQNTNPVNTNSKTIGINSNDQNIPIINDNERSKKIEIITTSTEVPTKTDGLSSLFAAYDSDNNSD